MLIFIDESGDTGLDIKKGATKYFTMAMVVFEDLDEANACDQRINLLRRELNISESYEFHFHTNSCRVRKSFLKAVLPYDFFYYGVVINKPKLYGGGFQNKESFYKYACSLIFENAKEKISDSVVVIDESGRKLFKYQLAKYLRHKANTDRRRIKKVKTQDSKSNNLLQLADMIAGAINRSLISKKSDKDIYRDIIDSREIYVQIWPK